MRQKEINGMLEVLTGYAIAAGMYGYDKDRTHELEMTACIRAIHEAMRSAGVPAETIDTAKDGGYHRGFEMAQQRQEAIK